MTRSLTASKVLLVADRRPAAGNRDPGPVRRYRIARLRFDSRPVDGESRFDYLRRLYD